MSRYIHLLLGGARSGKSARAAKLALERSDAPTLIATAEPRDAEMTTRIAVHRARREPGWSVIEEPLDLAVALDQVLGDAPVVVDCLTLWLSNLIEAGRDPATEGQRLGDRLRAMRGPVFLVSNELGLGLVPETPLGRVFRDAQGQLNQRIAALADRVEFMAAGLPLCLKG